MPVRLAIALDDEMETDVLKFVAQKRGHQVICVEKPDELFRALPFEPTAIICRVGGADQRTVHTVQALRDKFSDAALLLTAERLKEPAPRVLVEAGADEIVKTPYNPTQVIIGLERLALKPGQGSASAAELSVADLRVDLQRFRAEKNGQALVLTKLELRLLNCLAEHYPHLTPMDRLLSFGWEDMHEPDPALVKTHISHLRRKMEQAGGASLGIISRQGVGYTLVTA
jgi:DNA-binding response OmpR family regulator